MSDEIVIDVHCPCCGDLEQVGDPRYMREWPRCKKCDRPLERLLEPDVVTTHVQAGDGSHWQAKPLAFKIKVDNALLNLPQTLFGLPIVVTKDLPAAESHDVVLLGPSPLWSTRRQLDLLDLFLEHQGRYQPPPANPPEVLQAVEALRRARAMED